MQRYPIHSRRSVILGLCGLLLSATVSFSCTSQTTGNAGADSKISDAQTGSAALTVGAIPDHDPEKLQRLYGILAD
ncbi:MAG: hypothetical protein AAF635_14130, partial [Cyanobacteria bacterium P01_C01_bin.69]